MERSMEEVWMVNMIRLKQTKMTILEKFTKPRDSKTKGHLATIQPTIITISEEPIENAAFTMNL
jgi:hypothetical protein